MSAKVSPYPWSTLPTLSGTTEAQKQRVRRWLRAHLEPERLDEAIGRVLCDEAQLTVAEVNVTGSAASSFPTRLAFTFGAGNHLEVALDTPLAGLALSRVLKHPPRWLDPSKPLTPPLLGALSAIFIEIVRASHTLISLKTRVAVDRPKGNAVIVRGTVRLDGAPYPFEITLWANALDLPVTRSSKSLRHLGVIPLTLPLVLAASTGSSSELEQLNSGDVWLPDGGWLCDPNGRGQAALCLESGEVGHEVAIQADGSLVFTSRTITLTWDPPALVSSMPKPAYKDRMVNEPEEQQLAEALLDVPVVVRVELGAVRLSAKEWADLAPGDVIDTQQRIAAPVTLRISGEAVAEGELVNIDGQIGVRIQRLVGANATARKQP